MVGRQSAEGMEIALSGSSDEAQTDSGKRSTGAICNMDDV